MRRDGVPCPVAAQYRDLRYGISDYDIHWQGGGRPFRLIGCRSDRVLDLAVANALLDIGISPYGGERLRPARVRKFRVCLERTGDISC